MNYQPDTCGFCRRRGEACLKHGGTNSQKYAKKREWVDKDGNLDKQLPPPPLPFTNPYNCSMCGRLGAICDMHRTTAVHEPKAEPPKFKPYEDFVEEPKKPEPSQTPISQQEQVVGSHRIVQIKVGDVIITIKEPLK